jgi:hypothetical protein
MTFAIQPHNGKTTVVDRRRPSTVDEFVTRKSHDHVAGHRCSVIDVVPPKI